MDTCADCCHHASDQTGDTHWCYRRGDRSPVTGASAPQLCEVERSSSVGDHDSCGPDGRFFETRKEK